MVLSRVAEMGGVDGVGGDSENSFRGAGHISGSAAELGSSLTGAGGSGGTESVQRRLEQSMREQQRLSDLLKDERRKNRRNEQALIVEREMNLESQRIIDSLHREEEGFTSTSS